MVNVELIYIQDNKAIFYKQCNLADSATVKDALDESGLLSSHPEVINMTVGIFSTVVSLDAYLKDGDRIEIYRPLLCDPKERRRRHAQINKI